LAEELREVMAQLGFKTINEMVGQTQLLKSRDNINHWKYKNLNLSSILYKEIANDDIGLYKQDGTSSSKKRPHLDHKLIQAAKDALESKKSTFAEFPIINTDRTVGAMLSYHISKIYEGDGLPNNTIHNKFIGSAGQSFGAFLAPGVYFELEGEANDYFGKGLSGGKLVVYPSSKASFKASENIIIGNVAFYGATNGEAYINGMAGERFCVRNSGAKTVVEGVGDHGCEYMTGGIAVILGETGRNFAAGMSGGIAYIFDVNHTFEKNLNKEMVELENLDTEDLLTLKILIQNHQKYCNSSLAKNIIDNWELTQKQFLKVMPTDYKRVLAERKSKAESIKA
jgi:glutamate synthase (NADPH/NADH) large chain